MKLLHFESLPKSFRITIFLYKLGEAMKCSSLLLCGILLGVVACNSGGNGSKNPASNTEATQEGESAGHETSENKPSFIKISKSRKVNLENDFSNLDEFKSNINKYILTLKSESGSLLGAEVECRKKNILDRDNVEYRTFFKNEGLVASVEVSIEPKNPVSVEIECLILDRGELLATKVISLRKSFVISGVKNVVASGLGFEPIETLLLDEDSVLVTDGSLFTILTNEFISKNAKIVTFTEEVGATVHDNEPGANGGSIHINTQFARGQLTVELRGRDAGQQTIVPGMNPAIPSSDPALNGICGGSETNIDSRKMKCWGKRGHTGFSGFKGITGFDGGSTGILFFESQKENKLNLKVSYHPGKSGKGGVGGAGSKGGPGGKGSYVKEKPEHTDRPCGRCLKSTFGNGHQYPDGAEGLPGIQGEDGDWGKEGAFMDSKVVMNKEDMKFNFNFDWMNY